MYTCIYAEVVVMEGVASGAVSLLLLLLLPLFKSDVTYLLLFHY